MRKPLATLAVLTLAVAGCATDDSPVTEAQIQACHEAAANAAKYPGGANFIDTYYSTLAVDGKDEPMLTGTVDLLNGFGVPVRHQFTCVLLDDGQPVRANVRQTNDPVTEGEKVWPK